MNSISPLLTLVLGESVSGMGSNKDIGSGKPGRVSGSKGLHNSPERVSATGGPDGVSEMNAYRGGMRKPKVDSSEDNFFPYNGSHSFCIS